MESHNLVESDDVREQKSAAGKDYGLEKFESWSPQRDDIECWPSRRSAKGLSFHK